MAEVIDGMCGKWECVEMSNIENWFEAIRESGRQRTGKRVAIRKRIEEKGPPDAVFPDKELDEEIRMWRIKGGVLAIPFRENRPDIDRILTYTDEFIDVLISIKQRDLLVACRVGLSYINAIITKVPRPIGDLQEDKELLETAIAGINDSKK